MDEEERGGEEKETIGSAGRCWVAITEGGDGEERGEWGGNSRGVDKRRGGLERECEGLENEGRADGGGQAKSEKEGERLRWAWGSKEDRMQIGAVGRVGEGIRGMRWGFRSGNGLGTADGARCDGIRGWGDWEGDHNLGGGRVAGEAGQDEVGAWRGMNKTRATGNK
ncbi:hypothetical protein Tco_0002173 [Tanacetum coccineum]